MTITTQQRHRSAGWAHSLVLALLIIGYTSTGAAAPPQAGGWDPERVMSGEDDWEPANAVDPVEPNYVYQLTTRYSGPKACGSCKLPAIILRRSIDGGANWLPDQFLAASKKRQYDPQIEVADNGHVYAAYLDSTTPGTTFTKSTDFGATWSPGITWGGHGKKPQWNDKPWLIVSRDGQHVYIGFNSSDSYVVASHDGGATFSDPVQTNDDTRYWFHSGGAVSPSNPMVAYFATSNFEGTYSGDAFIDVLKTTDGGVTWTTHSVDTSREVPPCGWAAGCYTGFLGSSAAMAIDSAGTLMIVYNANDAPGVPEQMFVRTSTDGIAWNPRQQISVLSPSVNNAFPAVAAHPNDAGDFRVTWQDDSVLSHSGWNTWYRRTTDSGSSWSTPDVRVSDVVSGAPYKNANGYAFPYGDYHELSVDSLGLNHVVWGEGASYSGPGGTWYTRGGP